MADLKESEVHRGGVEEDRRHVQQHRHLPRVRPVALHHALDYQLALVFFSGGAVAGFKWNVAHKAINKYQNRKLRENKSGGRVREKCSDEGRRLRSNRQTLLYQYGGKEIRWDNDYALVTIVSVLKPARKGVIMAAADAAAATAWELSRCPCDPRNHKVYLYMAFREGKGGV